MPDFSLSPAVDNEPAGPLAGNLRCDYDEVTCAWADYSGIVVVSQSPPSQINVLGTFITYPGGFYSEQALAALTQSWRGAAEVLKPRRDRATSSSPDVHTS